MNCQVALYKKQSCEGWPFRFLKKDQNAQKVKKEKKTETAFSLVYVLILGIGQWITSYVLFVVLLFLMWAKYSS